MTGSPAPLATRQAAGTSSAIDVTFLSASESVPTSRLALSSRKAALGTFTRSKITPRLTANGSLRWPTKTLPGEVQPGMLIA